MVRASLALHATRHGEACVDIGSNQTIYRSYETIRASPGGSGGKPIARGDQSNYVFSGNDLTHAEISSSNVERHPKPRQTKYQMAPRPTPLPTGASVRT